MKLKKITAEVPKAEPKKDWIEQAMDFIKHYEWMRLTAYPDAAQWSIWYWTKSYKGEVITEQEAWERFYQAVKVRWDRTYWTVNQRVALTSFIYNCWPRGNILNFSKKWDHKSVTYLINSYCKTSWGKRLPWLVKRRNAEVELYKL